jgi:hypothetical protein
LTPLTQEYPFDLPLGEHIQNILVLKKINKDFPDDAYLTGRFEENKSTYASNIMCERVNKIIYEFKSYK